MSRPAIEFEQALREGGTVMLKESPDLSSLVTNLRPSSKPSKRGPPSPLPRIPQTGRESTLFSVVPPTPPASAGANFSAGSRSPQAGPSSPPSAFDGSFNLNEPNDSEQQTKRRSLYRSPGTASSPDLATLIRKAKERGSVVDFRGKKEPAREVPPPLPIGKHPSIRVSHRPRSSTSSSIDFTMTPRTPKGKGRADFGSPVSAVDSSSPVGSDWSLTSPRSRASTKDSASTKGHMSSVRAKTSALFGKMLGQGTTRERSKTDPSSSAPPLPDFNAPVPPLPEQYRRSPTSSPIKSGFDEGARPLDQTKPLPPIHLDDGGTKEEESDDQSMMTVPQSSHSIARPGSPQRTIKSRSPDELRTITRHSKRRSMSVGEVELKAMAGPSSPNSLPSIEGEGDERSQWDSTFDGIMSDFEVDSPQLTLDLEDPMSTVSRTRLARAQTEEILSSARRSDSHQRPPLRVTATSPLPAHHHPSLTLDTPFDTPTVTLLPASSNNMSTSSLESTGPRTSLKSPVRSRSGSNPYSRTRIQSNNRPKVRGSVAVIGYTPSISRDSARLRVQRRSIASASEPSLIPLAGEGRASFSALSDHDLANDRSSYDSGQDDGTDLEAKGKRLADRCWNEDEEFLPQAKIAEWLGGQGRLNKIALHHYMNNFEFSGMRLDFAFRRFCAKLYLKAETQQVDRILEDFSRRYWDCNPQCILGSASVVHSVSYSLLLLNTDLHVAELATRMSRNQFVRNTLSTIQLQLQPSRSTQVSTPDLVRDDSSSLKGLGSDSSDAASTLQSRPKRSGSIASWNSAMVESLSPAFMSSPLTSEEPAAKNDSVTSVPLSPESKPQSSSSSSVVYNRNWESEVESLLKDMYTAVKNQQILLPMGNGARASTSSLVGSPNMMRNRGARGQTDRLTTLKRGSIRGLQSLIGGQTGISPYSSYSSLDGRASPSPSFGASTQEGPNGSSMSLMTPSLGFASNLSHTIIRESQEDDDHSIRRSLESLSDNISITDEELALHGPPWAKEGMLCRKQYWECTGKKAKSRNWSDVFVVIQKGELSMFTFGEHGTGGSSVVGGGNWLENANNVGNVHLAHSLAHVLPPPGYNRQRPHCMVLTLSNGAVYFFQAGTEELVNEWVATCNYWAARTTKEPLTGGVSNMEYGWNRVEDSMTRGRSASEDDGKDTDTLSVRSGRSGRAKYGWGSGAATMRASPWADRIYINDWKPPLPPSVPSTHDEDTQLEALEKHVATMKAELQQHNELRAPMTELYQPRSANATKAQSNWEKKSQWLLAEIVKYESYIDSLKSAMTLRLKKRGEKALERALGSGNGNSDDDPSDDMKAGKWNPDEETILEGDEPSGTPTFDEDRTSRQSHRRERAEDRTDDAE